MRIRSVTLSLLLAFGLTSVAATGHASADGNASVLSWTCTDRTYLTKGVPVVGKSYLINTELYKNSRVATLDFTTTESTKNGQTTFKFLSVKIETYKGSYKSFEFNAAIGHTSVLFKAYSFQKNSYSQKLNLSYTASSSKAKQVALAPRLVTTSVEARYQVECLPSNVFRDRSMGKTPPGEKVVSAAFAKVGSQCGIAAEISFGIDAPLECNKGKWSVKTLESDSVATRAYRSLIARYNAMPTSEPNLLLRIDPEAGIWKNDVASGIIAGARLWGTSKEGDRAIPSYISEKGEYVSARLKEDGINENPEDAKRNRDAAARGGGQAGSHGQYFDFIFSDNASNGYGFYQVGAHEYTHYAQQVLSNSRTGNVPREFWMDEGCATFVGTGMGAVLNLPQNQRAELLVNLAKQKSKMPLVFFSRGNQSSYSDPRINEVYDTGFLACEALVALKGIDSIESVYRELSSPTADYDTSLKAVYGVGQDVLIPILQKYIDSVRGGRPLSLKDLEGLYNKARG